MLYLAPVVAGRTVRGVVPRFELISEPVVHSLSLAESLRLLCRPGVFKCRAQSAFRAAPGTMALALVTYTM